MAFHYEIDLEHALVRVRGGPGASVAEWRRTMDALMREPGFRPGLDFLNDFREVGPPTTDDIRLVREYLVAHADALGAVSWAVVGADAASFGMTRMLEQLIEHAAGVAITVRGFSSPDAALAWLRGRAA